MYWLLKDYSDYIVSLKYKKTKKEILKIELVIAKLKIDKVLNEINSNITKKLTKNILVSNDGNVIKIEISENESVS